MAKVKMTGFLSALILAVVSFFVIFFFFPATADRCLGTSLKNGSREVTVLKRQAQDAITDVSSQISNVMTETVTDVTNRLTETVNQQVSDSVRKLITI